MMPTRAAQDARAALGDVGLGLRQRQTLALIADRGTSWIHEISDELGTDRPSAAGLVRTLKQRGLIENCPRIRHDASPYAKQLRLTARGRQATTKEMQP